jgi:FKBP-type peptidyl-prolyl cis-trans isomerase (trigger factor)
MNKIKVKVNVVIEDILNTINIEVNDNILIDELIKCSVNVFNKKYEKENMRFRLSQNYSKHSLKQSKKNGYPKDDLPSILFLIRL